MNEVRHCDQCRFTYVTRQEYLHRKRHDRWQHGVPIPSGRGKGVTRVSGVPDVVFVEPTAPMTWRRLAEEMARFGKAETDFDFSMYSARAARESERTALLGVEDGRARAVLIIGPTDEAQRYGHTWEDLDSGTRDPAVTDTAKPSGGWWTIWFAWTVKEQRRRGWAIKLVQAASTWTTTPAPEFLWETPFSESGEQLVRRVTAETGRFWR